MGALHRDLRTGIRMPLTRPALTRLRAPAMCLLLVALAPVLPAQGGAGQAAFFQSDDVLAVTIRTDLRGLLGDRDTAAVPWRAASLTYAGPDGAVTVPLRLRTRGIFRLTHCDFPPIRLRFGEDDVRGTLWEGLRRPKLVTHCMDRTEYEQYLLQEYAIYRIYQLFTPVSLSARLLRVTYEDVRGAVRPVTRYAFVTEDPDRFAERLGGALVDEEGVRLARLARSHTAQLSVFQYLVANTDWGVPPRHNIMLLRTDTLYAAPCDFDWSGVIAAPYARPVSSLRIRSVRDRLYTGLCQTAPNMEPVLARFEALRDSIAAVYWSVPGLDRRIVERTLRYYDEFYRTIADRQRFEQQVVAPTCTW